MNEKERKYDNYVFDLYGTLIDIRTDENDLKAWEKMARFYRYYGAGYEPLKLKDAYETAVKEALDESWAEHTGGERPGLASERASARLLRGKEPMRPAGGELTGDLPEDHVIDTAEIRIETVFRRLYEDQGVNPDEELLVFTCRLFRIVTTVYIRLFPGVKERLSQLRDQGARLYLLTNAQRVFTSYELHIFGLDECFDGILMSSDMYYKKPDRRFYESLIRTYGLDPARSLMCGDDFICDVAGARRAGMDGFLVRY